MEMREGNVNEVLYLLIGIALGVLIMEFVTFSRLSIRDVKINKLTHQIDSLKKQDSIKELYRVYNIPTGADTLLKPISK